MEKKEAPKDIIAKEIFEAVSLDGLKAFYESFIVPFITSDSGKKFRENNSFLLKKISLSSKKTIAEIIGTIFGDQEYFSQFYHFSPKDLQTIIYQLVWFNAQYIKHLEAKFSFKISVNEKRMFYAKIQDKYLFFSDKNHHQYSGSYYFLQLKKGIRAVLQEWFRELLPNKLQGHTEAEFTDCLEKHNMEREGQALSQITTLVTYFNECKINRTAAGKISASTLKELKKVGNIQELYPSEKGALGLAMTNLIANFFSLLTLNNSLSNPLVLTKYIVDSWMFIRDDLIQSIYLPYVTRSYHSNKSSNLITEYIFNSIQELNKDTWYSIKEFTNYIYFTNQNFFNYIDSFYILNIQLIQKNNNKNEFDHYLSDVRPHQVIDILATPIIKNFFAIMATLGLVELVYSKPNNQDFRIKGQEYLSVFDGLQYVRLTDLGLFILGKTKDYEYKKEIVLSEKVTIELDPNFLLISLSKPDVVKEALLRRFAEKATSCRFKVSFRSFLKQCSTPEDVKAQVKEFEKSVAPAAEWPPNWQAFMEKVQQKLRPIRLIPNYLVFKLEDDPELLQVFQSDPVLSKLILRAEGRHILVEQSRTSELKGRLGLLGYIMP
ncbi:MAG: hypothetical protein J0L94_08300 [Rhodothermia bacterium]|nr:hypothetical protein [Rhodothermia bacterium]